MTNDNDKRDALERSLQARISMCGYDAMRIVDALMMRLERHRLDVGEIDIANPGDLPDDAAIHLLARRVANRDAERAERLRAIEDEEMPVYMEAR
jgi:hypothetical protein